MQSSDNQLNGLVMHMFHFPWHSWHASVNSATKIPSWGMLDPQIERLID